jgi:hypothetical protein
MIKDLATRGFVTAESKGLAEDRIAVLKTKELEKIALRGPNEDWRRDSQ